MSSKAKYILFVIAIGVVVLIINNVLGWLAKPNNIPDEQQPVFEDVVHPLIRVDSPKPGATISSPLTITGEARGTWYFEASFPVILKDEFGNVLAQTPAQAKGDWMTEEFVPFEATLTFRRSRLTDRGILVLKKDNPSDLPQFDDVFEIPVFFADETDLFTE